MSTISPSCVFSHNVIDDCFDFVRAGQWFYLIENGAVAIEGSVVEQSAPRSLLKSWSLGDSNP